MRKLSILLLFLATSIPGWAQDPLVGAGKTIDPYHIKSLKSGTFQHAAVASAHPLASSVGLEIMKRGGNAFDAAIATQLALAVVYPVAGNIGGGGFLLGRKADGKLLGLDFRETAPAKASRDMYLDAKGNAQTQLSQYGHLASGTPGTIAGLFATLPYAKLPFKELIQPAIDLAEHGFVLTAREASGLNNTASDFIKYSTQASALANKKTWHAGDTLIQKALAITLKRIRDKGQKGFYEGKTARLIVAEMKRKNGIISLQDLKNYQVKARIPLSFNYKGHQVIGFPPPSSGGIILAQMMKMLEARKLDSLGFHTPQSVQLMIEAERRAFADRAEHLGDPDFWQVPVDKMMSDTYLKNRLSDFQEGVASKSKDITAGNFKESEQTTHLSILDSEGNMVSVTTTLNGAFGSKTIVGGAGFLLNNEMDDFSIKPGVANMYGAVGGNANAIAANKRMLSSMCPTLVLKNKQPYVVIGTPGGTTIPTSVFQDVLNIIDFKLGAKEAINAPKFHHQWLPDEVAVEKNFPNLLREQLVKMGYKITERETIGRMEVIVVNGQGKLEAAADKRGDDSVAGY
ncbi:MAG: gamma-glutamyltransferase [Sphingobacteriaceae bacterium]